MDIKKYKSGTYRQQYQYKSFYPEKINHVWIWTDAKINTLLERANKVLGELNAFSLIIPNIDIFIQMHVVKEANTSSRIEGTNTEIKDVFIDKKYISPERRDDWQEVQNYIKAMNYAIKKLNKIPLSNRLLKETHRILLQSVRGKNKQPGTFRISQNWIGGSNLSDAVFIPPYQDDVPEVMSDLEKFLHNMEIDVPHLIKIAIAHYQFETIHPFLDGNGRIGRLLITLYLVEKKLLKRPCLYLSDYFEKYRTSYFDALSRVRESNDLTHWIKFFLTAVIKTADKGKHTFQKILKIKEELENRIISIGRRAPNAKRFINLLYGNPIIQVNDVKKELDVSLRTAQELVNLFLKLEILSERTGFKRNRTFEFKKYLDLF